MNKIIMAAGLALMSLTTQAKVTMPSVYADGMVMQRGQVFTLRGNADAGEQFEVVFLKKHYAVTAAADGSWSLALPAQKAGGPYTMQVADRTLSNIYVGDVWLCSGQSNVDVMISRVGELYRAEVDNDKVPQVHLLKVENVTDVYGVQPDVRTTGWHELEPEYAKGFSAISYFLAKQMYERTKVPQGVIACSWGGTPIQAWMHADSCAWQTDRMQQLMIARDKDYVQSLRRTEMAANRLWSGMMYAGDPGRKAAWQQDDTDESGWSRVNVRTDRWGKPGAGSWWLRCHVQVDKSHAGKPCMLRVGTLVDADSTYVNGVCVGTTGYQYPPRRYNVPEGLLREGDNIVTVRITTGGARPEFIFPKPYCFDFDGEAELRADNDRINLGEEWLVRSGAQVPPRKDYSLSMQNITSALYNAMLAPLAGYPLNACVWYQGESNVGEAAAYERLLVSHIRGWRAVWGRNDMPFYVVQLPNYMGSGAMPEESGWVTLRESQRRAAATVGNATIVTGLGLGEKNDIHPLRKKEMAARIMAEAMGEGAPKLGEAKEAARQGGGAIVSFDRALREDEVHGLELSADGRKFYNARGVAAGNTLTVFCDEVTAPVAVRYAWHNSPDDADLCGKNGQPVCTFEAQVKPIALAEGRGSAAHRAWLNHKTTDLSKAKVKGWQHRLLNHWDNLNGSIERGYAGRSIFWEEGRNNGAAVTARDRQRWHEYGELCRSIGINGAVLNNVNAKPAMLSDSVLARTKEIADVLRTYGITTYLSINFASPKALGGLPTGDPLDPAVVEWWKQKANQIYALIPDFGGFLVKANSEGEPGPMDYGRTHADGANMLAAALKPHGGVVMWRAFVYAAGDKDRAKQAYEEFMPLDGKFADNVIIQIKNGPIDFQPCEPYSPLFTAMKQTRTMPELQITMEYLGQERWLTFLAPQWKRFMDESGVKGDYIAAVANIGDDDDWCGSIFNQANLYAYGRLALDPSTSARTIAEDWQTGTFGSRPVTNMMLESWHNTVDAMMPLGLHHIFAGEHHYGPEPWYAPQGCRVDWTPPYYHKADKKGIGFDRTEATGTGATAQYPEAFGKRVEDAKTCDEDYLLWFHHLPWTHRMKSGRTLWDELCVRYDRGLKAIRQYADTWQAAKGKVDAAQHEAVAQRLKVQAEDAAVWHDACILYFQSINNLYLPNGIAQPQRSLDDIKQLTEQQRHLRWKDSPRKN